MKQAGIYTFGIFFALSYVFVFAEENIEIVAPILQKREEIKDYIEQKQIELRPQIEEKRQEIKNQIETKGVEEKTILNILAQERILKIISIIFEQFEAVLVKFEGIVVRIETRINKLNEQGVSTLEAEDLLLQAKKQIQDSTTLITATKLEIQTAVTTGTSKEDIKNSIKLCKTKLKETQDSLIKVVSALKNTEDLEKELSVE